MSREKLLHHFGYLCDLKIPARRERFEGTSYQLELLGVDGRGHARAQLALMRGAPQLWLWALLRGAMIWRRSEGIV